MCPTGDDGKDTRQRTVSLLLPSNVIVVEASDDDWQVDVSEAERASLGDVAEARLRDFRAGRACARRALRLLGHSDVELLRTASRSPSWPPGVVGSITHTEEFCAAAVAPADRYAGLGIDAEPIGAVGAALVGDICTPLEIEHAERRTAGRPYDWPTLMFVMKEAAFKALSWTFDGIPEFHDCVVELDEQAGRGVACFPGSRHAYRRAHLGFSADSDLVYAIAWVDARA